MNKDYRMMTAKMLRNQGMKIHSIAETIGKSQRMVYYYLRKNDKDREIKVPLSKLDPFKPVIDIILQEEPDFNRELILKRIKKSGYTGGITTVRVYAKKKSDELHQNAVIRFETEPGFQAQVDWKVFGKRIVNGKSMNLYAFVMVLGFSRYPFVCFTSSMNMPTLLHCHIQAFRHFGGIPSEILYDNMKTAWICGENGKFVPNKRLLAFALHYGFTPRRCRIHRPQTKGKVERFIDYLSGNFMPENDLQTSGIDELNTKVTQWIDEIGINPIRDLKESRITRFEREKPNLCPLPAADFDIRDQYQVKVSRESMIQFETNRYSVPPCHIGKTLTLFVNPVENSAEIIFDNSSRRSFSLEIRGEYQKIFLYNDRQLIRSRWEEENGIRTVPKQSDEKKHTPVEIRRPCHYDAYIGGAV